MSEYAKFTRTQREYEMAKTDQEWQRLNRRERKWARAQFRAELACWSLALFIAGLLCFGVYSLMTHVFVPAYGG